MNELTSALAILTAMITPAVLITACGSLILTTSQRVGRVIEQTRQVSEQFEKLTQSEIQNTLLTDQRTFLYKLIKRATQRSRLLQRSLMYLYFALSVFVATSVAIGFFVLFGQTRIQQYGWIPGLLGIVGTGVLFYSSLLLIIESRIAVGAVDDEMDFVLFLSQRHAPSELLHSKKSIFKLQQRFKRDRNNHKQISD